MLLLNEFRFLVGIILIGIVLTLTGNGMSGGGIYSKPDDCKSDPNLPSCSKFCEDLHYKEGGEKYMTNMLCRDYYPDAPWVMENPYWKGEGN